MTWAKALSWRLRRHLLDPVGTGSVADVVRRLGPVPAWPDAAAELAIGARRTDGRVGDAARALAAGDVVKVYAFRGATHLVTPQDAGAYLAVRASSRMWELPSWESFYGLAPSDWPRFREYVRRALADGPLTHAELVAALRRSSRYRQVATLHRGGQRHGAQAADLAGRHGPGTAAGRRGHVPGSRRRPRLGRPPRSRRGRADGGRGVRRHPRPDDPERVHDWFGKGLGAKRRDVTRWLAEVDDRLETVTIEGDELLVLREDVDDLRTTPASTAVRLLPGRDPWVMAPAPPTPASCPPRAAKPSAGRRTSWSRGASWPAPGPCAANASTSPGSRSPVGCRGPRSTEAAPWPGAGPSARGGRGPRRNRQSPRPADG